MRSSLERHALELQPLHWGGGKTFHVPAHAVHMRGGIRDDPRNGLVDHGLQLVENLLAFRLVDGLAREVEQLIDARILVAPSCAFQLPVE